jgi:hypothetical protein
MPETFAGNVHFDDDDDFEEDNDEGAGPFSLTFIACHEVGHSIGLTHDSSGGGDVMRASISDTTAFLGLTADDIANLRSGYSSTAGSVVTLNDSGVWVDNGFVGLERGNTSTNPVNTLIEGVLGVPFFSTGVIVHIDAGAYAETMTITQNMELRAENGTVTIGN